MGTEVVEYGSIVRQNRELAECHRNADYSILHPPNVKIPWSVTDRLSWSEMRRVPAGLRVLETQADKPNGRLSVTCAAKYLSFKSETDFLSYVEVVVPDIIGPANYVLHGDGMSYRDRINAYSNTPFALHPSTQNQDLIDHIDHIQNRNMRDVIEHSQRYWGIGSCNYKPKSLLKFFRENAAVREWLTTLATLLTEPKLIPTFVPVRPETVSHFEEEFCKELFILSHAVQIMLFAPVYWHEDGSYKSTDSYVRRFPLKFPPPNSKDEKAFGEYTLDDLYRALILQEFLFRQTYDEREERRCKKLVSAIPPKADAQWLGYSVGRSEPPWVEDSRVSVADRSFIIRLPREIQLRIIELASSPKVTPTLLNRPMPRRRHSRVQSTWEDSILALKLSSRMMYKLAIAEQNVEGVVDQRVAFRMNLDIDTLRVFDMRLPDFLTVNGPSTLPVRKLLSISKIIPKSCATYEDPVWSLGSPVGDTLDLEKLPKLDEFSVIFPNVAEGWMIEDLPLVRPQTDVSGTAHTGIKWQFNTGLYPVPYKEGRFHDSHFIGSEKPSTYPKATITDEAIPYVAKWGYERSPGAIGGYWASFKYFEETRDVYFAPLSWKEVEPLVKGPFGENGREALYEDHTPRFVAKLRIIRQGTTPPTGWIKVEQIRPNDPKWKRQLLNTWKSVWYTLVDLRTKLNVIISPPKPCDYFLRQT
ncbi:hypothetical protein FMUND_10009 [Fusarium mundagurra]|uniref:Uncharacterized protein n=1 Tax=Fusarium mundagurra TaxID=1567541 RepID=A0A8H5YDQ3_9HYPO|nr:hypothetical protein FMUND_10009 [Fusarium mundagurra]